ncbi:AAA domain-containing protein [Estrella lausannensis]|uniref:DNA helicase n=1 Tax=Estrella lausannensis TaxID=483423 RepID=A0A0H5DQT0_9BACT|nr:AAA domain-containing protein [Estrella lausannensis]CRX37959.1 DNA helicase [Estrella lausannensis]
MNKSNTSLDPVRKRAKQLFCFLKALIHQRFPTCRQIHEQPFALPLSNLPDHQSIRFLPPYEENEQPLLEIRRPTLFHCPSPPESIQDWLFAGWNDCSQLPQVRETKPTGLVNDNQKAIERFDECPRRIEAFEKWCSVRAVWAEERTRANQALELFDRLYQQFALLEKEGGQLELLVGDGLLNWSLPSGGIHHPILLKRVELKFDPAIPAFTLINSDRPSEIHQSLLMAIDEIDFKLLQARIDELAESEYHPLGGDDTTAFLKTIALSLSPTNGEFLESPAKGEKDHPRMWREPFLFSNRRNTSYGLAVEKILKDIEETTCFPKSLATIAGVYDPSTQFTSDFTHSAEATSCRNDIADILLAKPANAAQINIIRRFNNTGLVHVQGPPGTGKTYTIGNVIGHLLAQGKRILVTSHTEKALRVLKEEVPAPLQSLCVSVLSNDAESRRQLEETINAVNKKLTEQDPDQILSDIKTLKIERESLLVQEQELRGRIKEIINAEYTPLEIDGYELEPSDAARETSETREGNDWIPGAAGLNSQLPITQDELSFLYSTNDKLTQLEELEIQAGLPSIKDIPAPDALAALITEYRALQSNDLRKHKEYWNQINGNYRSLNDLAERLFNEFSQNLIKQTWRPSAIKAGKLGDKSLELWETLCDRIERTSTIAHRLSLQEHLQPTFDDGIIYEDFLEICKQIHTYVCNGNKLGLLTLLMRGNWKNFLQKSRVVSGEPHRKEHFEALGLELELRLARRELAHLWNQLIASHGGKLFAELGSKPEIACQAIIPEIRRCLDWYKKTWSPILRSLGEEGLNWSLIESRVPCKESILADYIQIEEIVAEHLPEIISSELCRRRLHDLESELQAIARLFRESSQGISLRFLQAVQDCDIDAYRISYKHLLQLLDLQPIYEKRQFFLLKIDSIIPSWAAAIQNRIPPHDSPQPPGNLINAWRWLRISSELEKRQKEDFNTLQETLNKCQERIRYVTIELIEKLTWERQIRKVKSKPELKQSLSGWLELQKKILSTRIKTILLKLKKAAKRELEISAEAAPVWIMPLHAITEHFDPASTKFDVVIIDEASQANLTALIPLYMADQAIIVGDHEQTTPEAVGVQQEPIQNLIDIFLQGIPNKELFDLSTSIYDLARRCFGETIVLTEHFRCIPEIIEFSNQLSYDGKILPLREKFSSTLKPSTIAYRVQGTCHRKTNDAEASAIARLILAMTKHPAYENSTIGVISLLGDEQARLIDTKIRAELPAKEYINRRIICGTAAEFQGDARDVIFISLVDSLGDDELSFLRKKGEGAFAGHKKRFNVAASRARDQLWVMHSMDPHSHLKPGDIRRDLILHAQNPQAASCNIQTEITKADSIFEIQVMKFLAQQGYRVKSQWQVGHHRIDLVVVGETNRLAIECDGDRWHPPAKRDEDLARQALLERIGWKFARIRGTCFFRNPVEAMKPIFDKLEDMGIARLGQEPESQVCSNHILVRELELIAWPEKFTENETVLTN